MLDIEARSRGTTGIVYLYIYIYILIFISVYLADRKFDMLPTVLSEDLCSLREGVDRYNFFYIYIYR